MIEKNPPSWSSPSERSMGKPATKTDTPAAGAEKVPEKKLPPPPAGDRSVLSHSAAPDTYLQRVAAATGKPVEGMAAAHQKMTSENYQEIYKKQQEAALNAAQKRVDDAAEELKKAAEAKRQLDIATREKQLNQQIDAWRKTLGQGDADADGRTRVTIENLSRELASLRKK